MVANSLLLPLLFLSLTIRCAAAEGDNNVVASDGREYDQIHKDNGVQESARSSDGRWETHLRDKLWLARCTTAATMECKIKRWAWSDAFRDKLLLAS